MNNSIIGATRTITIDNEYYINAYYGVNLDTRNYFVTWAVTIDKPYADLYTQEFTSRKACETFYANLVSTFLTLSGE